MKLQVTVNPITVGLSLARGRQQSEIQCDANQSSNGDFTGFKRNLSVRAATGVGVALHDVVCHRAASRFPRLEFRIYVFRRLPGNSFFAAVGEINHVRRDGGAIANIHRGIRRFARAHAIDEVGHVILIGRVAL